MTALSFLSPFLLWGMLLASVPIIIHLLFRRRFRRIEWAPMHYLKLSLQRNRRRIRLEQLLLLALRVAIVLVLFCVVARPVLRAQGLGAWLGGRSRTSQLIVIDDSLSMAFSDSGRSAFQHAQDVAAEILKSVGSEDRLTLVLASRPTLPLLREIEATDREAVLRQLGELPLSDAYVSWDATLEGIDELVKSGTYPIRRVAIVTDLRHAGWDARVGEIGSRWAANRVELEIFDVGSPRTDDIALLDLVQKDRVALVGTATGFEAVLRNGGSAELEGIDATLTVDGRPSAVRLPAIAPGSTARIPLAATFQESGMHHVSFALPGDDLRGDDQRWVVVPVRDQLSILLVDGEPSGEPLGGEVDFLALALSLSAGEGDAWQVEVTTDTQWEATPLARPDLVVLANLPSLTAERAGELERLVRDGCGLMIFVGDQVDPDNYNRVLYRDGAGLLPVRLESPIDADASGLVLEDAEGTPLEALAQLDPAVLERIRVRKIMSTRAGDETDPAVRVLARWNNPAGSPAALAKDLGAGRVLLWTVTADKDWSDWPTEPSYVLAVREAARAICRGDANDRNLTAGDTIRRLVPPRDQVHSPTVEAPAAESPLSATLEQETVAGLAEPLRALAFRDTGRAGLYRLTWRDASDQPQHDLFAVNPDRRESELARIAADDLRTLFGSLEVRVIPALAAADAPLAIRGQEIWRSIALVLLGLLALETVFATWAGRQR